MIVFKLGDCKFSYHWSRAYCMYLFDIEPDEEHLIPYLVSPEELPYFFECIEWVAKQKHRKLSDYIKSIAHIGGIYIG